MKKVTGLKENEFYQLTKSQIIQIAENGSLVKELFPDVFEESLEVEMWYKVKTNENTALVLIKENDKDVIKGYGFFNDEWREEICFEKRFDKDFDRIYLLTTPEEVETALKLEKEKRYKLHTDNIKWLSGEPIETLQGDLCYFENNKLYASGGSKRWCLFDNGTWAEILQTPNDVIKVIETYGTDKLITLIEAYDNRNSK